MKYIVGVLVLVTLLGFAWFARAIVYRPVTVGIQADASTPESSRDGPYRFCAAWRQNATIYLEPGKFDALPKRVERRTNDTGEASLVVELQPDDARRFEEFTRRNVDRPLAILVDGEVVCVANIAEPLPGAFHIFDRFTQPELDELLRRLSR